MGDVTSAPGRQTVCVDFDGVLHSYVSGWQGETVIPDPPVDGAIEWLNDLAEVYDIAIFTTRGATLEGRLAVVAWLAENGFTGVLGRVTNEKVPAILYIDDRAWVFRGRFPRIDRIATMYPWRVGMPIAPPVRARINKLEQKNERLRASLTKVEERQARLKVEHRELAETFEEAHSALHAALGDVPRCDFCPGDDE